MAAVIPKRIFLGWEKPLIAEAIRWLINEYPDGFTDLIIGVPGGRASWHVRELLSQSQANTLLPPKVVTAGRIPEEILEYDMTPASPFLQSLVWQKALLKLGEDELQILTTNKNLVDGGGLVFADEIQGLYRELAGEGHWFSTLSETLPVDAPDREKARWQILAKVEKIKDELLEGMSFCDPQNTRHQLIEKHHINSGKQIVLLGLPDMNNVLKSLIDAIPERVTILIGAPETLSATFDEYGTPRVEHWGYRPTELTLDDWRVAEDPAQQAELTIQSLESFQGMYRAEQISVGVPDHSVSPYIQRKFEQDGIVGRDAAGTPISKSTPTVLMGAVATFLSTKEFSAYAWLLRHPDIQETLPFQNSATQDLDRYFNEHFPVRITDKWFSGSRQQDKERKERLERNYEQVEELLGELGSVKKMTLRMWVPVLKRFLETIYGSRTLLPHVYESDRVLAETFEQFLIVFENCEHIPDGVASRMGSAEAIDFVLRELSSIHIPPGAHQDLVPTIELLGWLELALDDAPALIITGMNNGSVPAPLSYTGWLPDSLRSHLGLDHRDRRFARDAYILEFLLHAKERIQVISGQRTIDGDPVLPSRLLLNVDEERIAAYAQHALEPTPPRHGQSEGQLGENFLFFPSVDLESSIPNVLPVTAFRTYLQSPYMFYLDHIQRLETIDDNAQELDAAGFGNLAHYVLEYFGNSKAKNSESPKEIRDVLFQGLDWYCRNRFGNNAKPAIDIQIQQLRHRLTQFADEQAQRRSEGWIIQDVESNTQKDFIVDDVSQTIRGRIDRIDKNERTGQWAILDYKTPNTVKDPQREHKSQSGEWTDLQLPLYWFMLQDLIGSSPCSVGYVNVIPDQTAFMTCSAHDMDMDDAIDTASEIIRSIRNRQWSALGKPQLFGEDIFADLCGEGLVGGMQVEIDDD